ncbi:hypothetical protein RJ55_06738 [Drechmeria coniospora]|nr:hypothetical protein RJ55_06738 [Drechmeria coniospora]
MLETSTSGPRRDRSALHNLATYIRRTDQRRQTLRRLQVELAGDDAIFTLEIVVDGKTRWNSIYVMIERALELRCALELYQSRWQKPKKVPGHRDISKDFLTATDWTELARFHDFLKPFYILTKTMEGNASTPGAEGGHGAVWENLKTMDYTFVKFWQAAEDTQLEEASHFKSGIDCGWAKLEEYYVKTDRTLSTEQRLRSTLRMDLFSIPGMSAECERVFSQTKKMITDEHNRLGPKCSNESLRTTQTDRATEARRT